MRGIIIIKEFKNEVKYIKTNIYIIYTIYIIYVYIYLK